MVDSDNALHEHRLEAIPTFQLGKLFADSLSCSVAMNCLEEHSSAGDSSLVFGSDNAYDNAWPWRCTTAASHTRCATHIVNCGTGVSLKR